MTTQIDRRTFLAAAGASLCAVRGASALASVRGDILKPRRPQDIADSIWGVWTWYGPLKSAYASDEHSNYSFDPSSLELLEELGIKHAYVGWDWPAVEKTRGQYDFSVYDQIIRALRARRIAPWVQLYGSPNVAYGMDPAVKSQVMQKEQYLRAWLNAIGKTVERSRGLVNAYEIWNEPNAAPWFWTGAADPAGYARMVKEVARAVRAVDPHATIVAGSMAAVVLDYAEDFLAADSGSDWNGFSVHPYSDYPERETLAISQLKALLARHRGRDIPIFQSECGYPSSEHTGGWRGEGPWGEDIQAKWLLRRMLSDLSLGAQVSIYFALHDYAAEIEVAGAGKPGSIGVNEKGLVTMDGRRKPAFRALQNLCTLIDKRYSASAVQATVKSRLQSEIPGQSEANVTAFGLRSSGRLTHFLFWDASPLQAVYREGNTVEFELTELPVRRSVCVDLLTGEISSLKSRTGNGRVLEMPLKDYPVAIVDKDALPA
jgi:hypothetical protein